MNNFKYIVFFLLLFSPITLLAEERSLKNIKEEFEDKYKKARDDYDIWSAKYEIEKKNFEEWAKTQKGGYANGCPEMQAMDTMFYKMGDASTAMQRYKEEITIIEIMLSSSPENRDTYWTYYNTIAKEYSVRRTIESYRALSNLDFNPTIPKDINEKPTREESEKQSVEEIIIRQKLYSTRPDNASDEDIIKIRKIADEFKNHIALLNIFLWLGEAYENKKLYPEAEFYYRSAGEYPLKSDQWGYAQQKAWQKLSALYEKKEDYAKAVEALEKWSISEECGTGAMASAERKAEKLKELRSKLNKK